MSFRRGNKDRVARRWKAVQNGRCALLLGDTHNYVLRTHNVGIHFASCHAIHMTRLNFYLCCVARCSSQHFCELYLCLKRYMFFLIGLTIFVDQLNPFTHPFTHRHALHKGPIHVHLFAHSSTCSTTLDTIHLQIISNNKPISN